MDVEFTVAPGTRLAVTEIGQPREGGLLLVWGHGWGQSGLAFLPVAEALKSLVPSLLIDFPGFGKSPNPPDTWGTAEYADFVASWMKALPAERLVWLGHSFGGRVGLQLAARHSGLLSGLVLIASAGLQRRRSFPDKVRFTFRKTAFRTARRFVREGPALDRLRQRFGSADYRAAGSLRPVLARVVGEDLTAQAEQVRCPTLLIYGSDDTETPPEMGQRLQQLIPDSELALLNGFDHYSILTEGRHQVALRIRKFLERIPV